MKGNLCVHVYVRVCRSFRVLHMEKLRIQGPSVVQCQSETQRTHQDPEDQTQIKHTLLQIVHLFPGYNVLLENITASLM